jgi:hypothetical protein
VATYYEQPDYLKDLYNTPTQPLAQPKPQPQLEQQPPTQKNTGSQQVVQLPVPKSGTGVPPQSQWEYWI